MPELCVNEGASSSTASGSATSVGRLTIRPRPRTRSDVSARAAPSARRRRGMAPLARARATARPRPRPAPVTTGDPFACYGFHGCGASRGVRTRSSRGGRPRELARVDDAVVADSMSGFRVAPAVMARPPERSQASWSRISSTGTGRLALEDGHVAMPGARSRRPLLQWHRGGPVFGQAPGFRRMVKARRITGSPPCMASPDARC